MFPELFQFFGGTFHQSWSYDLDWDDYDGPRHEAAVISYINTNPMPVVRETFENLKDFRSKNYSEDEVETALNDFGCNIYLPSLKLSAHDFVESIYQIFEAPLERGDSIA